MENRTWCDRLLNPKPLEVYHGVPHGTRIYLHHQTQILMDNNTNVGLILRSQLIDGTTLHPDDIQEAADCIDLENLEDVREFLTSIGHKNNLKPKS